MRAALAAILFVALSAGSPVHGASTIPAGPPQVDREATSEELEHRSVVLRRTADAALAKRDYATATKDARELLQLARQPFPFAGSAWHHGHRVLGHVALATGDVEAAKKHLVESGLRPSPALNSFGPRFDLATALLARGERGAVVEYLRLCSRFWQGRQATLEGWVADIQAGGQPHLREFAPPDEPPR